MEGEGGEVVDYGVGAALEIRARRSSGEGYDASSRFTAGFESRECILEDTAAVRWEADAGSREAIAFGVGLGVGDIACRDDRTEVILELRQAAVDVCHFLVVAARDECGGNPGILECLQELECTRDLTIVHCGFAPVEHVHDLLLYLRVRIICAEDVWERGTFDDHWEVIDTRREAGVDLGPDASVFGFRIDQDAVEIEKRADSVVIVGVHDCERLSRVQR